MRPIKLRALPLVSLLLFAGSSVTPSVGADASPATYRTLVQHFLADYYRHDRVAFLDWIGGRFDRVLDVGCGAGDVSFLLARMVGPSGTVVGVDRSEDAVAMAN